MDDLTPTNDDLQTPSFSEGEAPQNNDTPSSEGARGSTLPSIGSLFKRTWATFQSRIITLLALYIISVLMMIIPTAIIIGVGYLASTFIPIAQPISIAIFALIGMSVGAWTMSWGMAAYLLAVSDNTLGIGGALKQGRSKAWGFIWVQFLVILIMYGALMLLFIPGIIVMIWLMPAIYVFINEDTRGIEAALKSREYVRGRWLAVFVRLLLLMIVAIIFSVILGLIPIIGPLVQIVLVPFYAIYIYTIYKDLKDTKGEFDFYPTRKGKLGFIALAVAGIILPFALFYVMVVSNPNSKMMIQDMVGQMIMMSGQMQGDFEGMEGFEDFDGFEEFDMEDFGFNADGDFEEEVMIVETPPPPMKAKVKTPPSSAPVVKKPAPKPVTKLKPKAKKIVVAKSPPVKPAAKVVPAAPPMLISGTPNPSTPEYAWHGPRYSVEKNIELLSDWSLPWIDRNEAARALGEAGDSRAVTPLKRALEEDPEPLVRREAALSLGLIGDTKAVKALTNAANNDDNEWVTKYATEALDMIANPDKIKRTTTKAAPAYTYDWVVNVASYTSEGEADRTSELLLEMNFDPYITTITLDETLWYRVRVGFFGSKTSADSTKREIEDALTITDAWSVRASANELSRH